MSPDGRRILSRSLDETLRVWDASWQGDDLFEIACKYTPMMSSKAEMERLSKRYGVKIEEPICQPGVKIPDPDWRRTEPAHDRGGCAQPPRCAEPCETIASTAAVESWGVAENRSGRRSVLAMKIAETRPSRTLPAPLRLSCFYPAAKRDNAS
jgi:hypothetical protein